MLDEEEAVGCWAGAGLQPPHTPPHTPASRVSHCLPLERLSSAGRKDEGKELEFCWNPSDEQCCHLVAVFTFSNKIWETGCKWSGLWYLYLHPIHHCTSQNTDTDTETITGRTVFYLCSVTIFIGCSDKSILQTHSCFIRIQAHSKSPPVDMVGVTFRVNPSRV